MRTSVQFARQRNEVIDHLAIDVYPSNNAYAETQFKPMIDKIVTELGGSIEVVERTQENGSVWKQRVVKFPDNSVARLPTMQDLRRRIREVENHAKELFASMTDAVVEEAVTE